MKTENRKQKTDTYKVGDQLHGLQGRLLVRAPPPPEQVPHGVAAQLADDVIRGVHPRDQRLQQALPQVEVGEGHQQPAQGAHRGAPEGVALCSFDEVLNIGLQKEEYYLGSVPGADFSEG
jgi:hypothetical protein